jgi:hypothetical protein
MIPLPESNLEKVEMLKNRNRQQNKWGGSRGGLSDRTRPTERFVPKRRVD